MSKYYFLVKGDKGLHYTNGFRMFFPDRKWTEAKAGVFTDLHVTVDKDSYAFVSGKMLETQPIKLVDVLDKFGFDTDARYSLCKLGDTELIASYTSRNVLKLYAKVSEDVIEVLSIDAYSSTNGMFMTKSDLRIRRFIADVVKCQDTIKLDSAYLKYCENYLKLSVQDKSFMLTCIKSLLYMRTLWGYKEVVDFTLIGDLVVCVRTKEKYTDVKADTYFALKDDYTVKRISSAFSFDNVKKAGVLTLAEVEEECMTNKICVSRSWTCQFVDSVDYLVHDVLTAFGEDFKVYAWDANQFRYEYLDDTEKKKLIDDSFDTVQSAVKRLGKHCSGRKAIDELCKLNLKQWLLNGQTSGR